MLELVVRISWIVAGIYAGLGVVAALALHLRGMRAIDPSADGGSIGFRILVTPGIVAMWPVLLMKWRAVTTRRDPAGAPDHPVSSRGLRTIHRIAVRVVAVVLTLVFGILVVPLAVSRAARTGPEGTVQGYAYELVEPQPEGRLIGIRGWAAPFGELPITARILEVEGGGARLELVVRDDLKQPALVLMWNPGADPSDLKRATFLGAVWGPGNRHYSLPAAAAAGGEFVIYSMTDSEVVAAAPIDQKGTLSHES